MTMGQVMAMGVDGVAEEAMVGEEASEEEVVVAVAFVEGEEEVDGDYEESISICTAWR
jgi:hypothetical protein